MLAKKQLNQTLTVAEAYRLYLPNGKGFLPPTIPLTQLPPSFRPFLLALNELAHHYHTPKAKVSVWLSEQFAHYDETLLIEASAMSKLELDKLMTVLSVLCHAYRWDSAPPSREAYMLKSLTLPPGLNKLWTHVAGLLEQPRVGNLYHMVLCNWHLPFKEGGSDYTIDELNSENLKISHSWLLPPEQIDLHNFLKTGIETEARGTAAVKTIIQLSELALESSTQELTFLLDRLSWELDQLSHPFKIYIQRKQILPDRFLTLIQPTTIWGLDEGSGPLEGASGPQIGSIQVIDRFLGIKNGSRMGRAILESRKYMPLPHRHFLANCDGQLNFIRDFITSIKDRKIKHLFNVCVSNMQAWRKMHQMRGATYLKGDTPGLITDYTSTGMIVGLEDERVKAFQTTMEERIQETLKARIEEPPFLISIENLSFFPDLNADDRELLKGLSKAKFYAQGEVLIQPGSKRHGLLLLKTGVIKVVQKRMGKENTLARLLPGQVLGLVSFIDNAEITKTVIAETDCCLDLLERESIYSALKQSPSFAARFYHSLAELFSKRLRERDIILTELLESETARPRARPFIWDIAAAPNIPSEIVDERQALSDSFRALEKQISNSPVDSSSLTVQHEVEELCNRYLALIVGIESYAEKQRAPIRDYLFREMLPFFFTSGMIRGSFYRKENQFLSQPMLESIYRGAPRGIGILGTNIDRWIRKLPSFEAIKEQPEFIGEALKNEFHHWPRETDLPVMCLANGHAQSLFSFFSKIAPSTKAQATIVEIELGNSIAIKQKVSELELSQSVTCIKDNILRIAHAQGQFSVEPQQVIYTELLLNYYSDVEFSSVIDWTYQNLLPGGLAIFSQFLDTAPDREFVDPLLNWSFVRRSVDFLQDLINESKFGGDSIEKIMTPNAAMAYLCCRKRRS